MTKDQAKARVALVGLITILLDNYMLDYCPEDQNWEDFDPEMDALREQAIEMNNTPA